jgi:hypothetical protein
MSLNKKEFHVSVEGVEIRILWMTSGISDDVMKKSSAAALESGMDRVLTGRRGCDSEDDRAEHAPPPL